MMQLAIDTLPGTEVDSAYSASLAYGGRSSPPATRTSGTGRSMPMSSAARMAPPRCRSMCATIPAARCRGLTFPGRFERPTDKRVDRPFDLAETGDRHLSRQRRRRSRRASGIWCIEGDASGDADVPVAQPRRPELGDPVMAVDARFFALRQGSRLRAVASRSRGRGRQLRRLHGQDRARAFGDPRRDAGAGQPDRPPAGAGMEGGRDRSGAVRRSPRRARLQGLSVRAGPRRDSSRRSRRACCCAASASPRLPP